uniref:SERPIN domain-containing protein n=1 Tax=Parastrongyloides trichosuri TaxID=131310 RepID=A0A0N4ZDR4_PARTI
MKNVSRFKSQNIKDALSAAVDKIGNLKETTVTIFNSQDFDVPLTMINKGVQRLTIVEGSKKYHRWQVSALDRWKLENNAIEDKNYLNENKMFPSILLASKCVLNADAGEMFNTTQRGLKNSETFLEQILFFNSNDYTKKYQSDEFNYDKNTKIPYSKNNIMIVPMKDLRSQKHCINFLKRDASNYYSRKSTILLSDETNISIITFLYPDFYKEVFAYKNGFKGVSKAIMNESLSFYKHFSISDAGSFKGDEFFPKLILPKYSTAKINVLEKNNIDPELVKGIIIQPRSFEEVKKSNIHVESSFVNPVQTDC